VDHTVSLKTQVKEKIARTKDAPLKDITWET
jgi:hypothetical protein